MVRVAGEEIGGAGKVREVVERQLLGTGPWSDKSFQSDVDGLSRALNDAGDLAPAFGRALLELLDHDSVVVRTGVIAVLGQGKGMVAADDLVVVLERAPQLFRGVAPHPGFPSNGDDLEAGLIHAISTLATASDSPAIALLRRRAQQDQPVMAALALARIDPTWFVAHASTAMPRNAIVGVLRNLAQASDRLALTRALAPWSADEAKATVETPFWKLLAVAQAERDQLAAIIRGKA